MKRFLSTILFFIFLVSASSHVSAVVSSEGTLLNRVATTGTSVAIPVANNNKVTFQITAASVTSGGVMKIEGSIDGTNWFQLNSTTISASGITGISINGFLHKYMRANLSSRTDGTYTVKYVIGD